MLSFEDKAFLLFFLKDAVKIKVFAFFVTKPSSNELVRASGGLFATLYFLPKL
jgi:hypothetical protein